MRGELPSPPQPTPPTPPVDTSRSSFAAPSANDHTTPLPFEILETERREYSRCVSPRQPSEFLSSPSHTTLSTRDRIFYEIGGGRPLSRPEVSSTFARANLSDSEVDVIWELCDIDKDGCLDEEEMILALHVAASRRAWREEGGREGRKCARWETISSVEVA